METPRSQEVELFYLIILMSSSDTQETFFETLSIVKLIVAVTKFLTFHRYQL